MTLHTPRPSNLRLFVCSYRRRVDDCMNMVAMHVTVVVMVLLDLLLVTTLLLIDQRVICGTLATLRVCTLATVVCVRQ